MSSSQRNDARLGADCRRGGFTGLGQVDGNGGARSADASKDSAADLPWFAIFMTALATIGPAMLLRLGLGAYIAHSK